MRALAIYGAFALDMTKSDESEYWETKSSLMIPIIKGWLTERSLEITSNAIQIHGGMGFIENNKAECMQSVLINTNLLIACKENEIKKYFFSQFLSLRNKKQLSLCRTN